MEVSKGMCQAVSGRRVRHEGENKTGNRWTT